MCVWVCVLEGRRGFRSVSLPGSLLGLHSLKLFFLQGTLPGREGQTCQGKKKGVGKSSQGCNCCYVGENTVVCFGLLQFSLVQVK